MSVPAHLARTELSVPMVQTSTLVNVLKVTGAFILQPFVCFLHESSILNYVCSSLEQVTQGSTVKLISMSAILTPATMVPVRTALPLSPATAVLATQAVSVKPTSMSVSASPARMVALVRTGKIPMFVTAQKELQVRLYYTHMKLLILLGRIVLFHLHMSTYRIQL